MLEVQVVTLMNRRRRMFGVKLIISNIWCTIHSIHHIPRTLEKGLAGAYFGEKF
jgi:hypothetical protein